MGYPTPDLVEAQAVGVSSILDLPYRQANNVFKWIPPQHWPAILNFAPLGQGGVDVTAYIQAAIDDLELRSWQDAMVPTALANPTAMRVLIPELQFPPGLYCVSGLETEGLVMLVGDGPASTFLAWTGVARLGKSPGVAIVGDVGSTLLDVVLGGTRVSLPTWLVPSTRAQIRNSVLGQGTTRLGGIRRMALVGTTLRSTPLEALVRIRPAARARFDLESVTLSGAVEAGVVASAMLDRIALTDVQLANLASDGVRLLPAALDSGSVLGSAGPMAVVSLRRVRVAGKGEEAFGGIRAGYIAWLAKRDASAAEYMKTHPYEWCLGGPIVAVPSTSRRVVVRWSHGAVRRRALLPVGSGALISCEPTSAGEVVVSLSDVIGEVHPNGHVTAVEQAGNKVSVRARNVAIANARHLVRPSSARIGTNVAARLDEIVPASATGLVLYGPRFGNGLIDNGFALSMDQLKADGTPVSASAGRRRGGDVIIGANPVTGGPRAARVRPVDEATWSAADVTGNAEVDRGRLDGFTAATGALDAVILAKGAIPGAYLVTPKTGKPPWEVLVRVPVAIQSPAIAIKAGDCIILDAAKAPLQLFVCTVESVDVELKTAILNPSSTNLPRSTTEGSPCKLTPIPPIAMALT